MLKGQRELALLFGIRKIDALAQIRSIPLKTN